MPSIEEAVNPAHYKGILVIPKDRIQEFIQPNGDLSLEYIDVMQFIMTEEEFIGHLKGQAFKYQFRLGKKDDSVQELKKSNWYLDYLGRFLSKTKAKL